MLPCERGHSGLTHSKPPPVLMQVVPRLQLCCWLKHSSTSVGSQETCESEKREVSRARLTSRSLVTAVWAGGYAPLCLFISFFFSFLFFLLSLPLRPRVLKMSSLFSSGKRRWGHSFHEQMLSVPRVQMKQHRLTSLPNYAVQLLHAAECNSFGGTSR